MDISSPNAHRIAELQSYGREINKWCPSPEQSIRFYASDGIKRKLRENTTDTFLRFKYIFVDSEDEFDSVQYIPGASAASEDVLSLGSLCDYKIIERIRALNNNPKFIDSVIEQPPKSPATIRMNAPSIFCLE
jgi:hypothetical protein